jgi:anthranilate synthase component 2
LGQTVEVYRNDKITINEIKKSNPEFLVISPGPCTPNEAGISIKVIKKFSGKIPILGVCLGFQAMVQAFGGIGK